MTWIKICGTTNLEDALTAVEAGADALGFVFYEKSPRNISIEAAREIIEKLPKRVEKVGVFVDADCDRMRQVVSRTGLTAIQLHGRNSRESVWQDLRPSIDCVGVSKLIDVIPGDVLKERGIGIEKRVRQGLFALLVDSHANGASGGTGRKFDWQAMREIVQAFSLAVPVIVAGGLTPSNVPEALKIFQPFGVDVVSGVEASPGKKDPEKLLAFVKTVRETDRKTS